MDKCVTVNRRVRPNNADFWIKFDYGFLEDSFIVYKTPIDVDDSRGELKFATKNISIRDVFTVGLKCYQLHIRVYFRFINQIFDIHFDLSFI